MRTLYPEINPYQTFFLDTGTQHAVYVELSGDPLGMPVVFLHGGPCSGSKPDHRRFFDPKRYHIILLDQRGCGQSLPFGELAHNTTQDLLADLTRIRERLGISQWVLFGGSWGATLALLYAQQYPQHVSGMIIRGVFLARQQDIEWFLRPGVGRIFPERWRELVNCLPEPVANAQLLPALYAAICNGTTTVQTAVAQAWSAWGAQVALAQAYQPELEAITEKTIKQARMELHYANARYFIAENQILTYCAAIQHIPTIIIHGRLDLVCPMEAALSLHEALPHAHYVVLPEAGHIAKGEAMIDALVTATDQMLLRLANSISI